MQIKICGLTRHEDVKKCLQLQVEWLGFNCYQKSPRYVTPSQIKELLKGVDDSVKTVGVFVNTSNDEVEQILQETGLQYAQLHGDETAEDLQALNVKAFKAVRSFPNTQIEDVTCYRGDYLLLDGVVQGLYGGTGQQADWNLAKKLTSFKKIFLAGGLNPKNVRDAMREVRPFAVDVCGGVESSKGVKDHALLEEFVEVISSSRI